MAGFDPIILIGGLLFLLGGPMAAWPAAVISVSRDEDGSPIPLTPANVRWMRIVGVAIIVLGVAVIRAGIVGAKGAEDPVLF
jgi:hypothetical protein